MLTDFKNSFTVRLGDKFATRIMSYFQPHIERILKIGQRFSKLWTNIEWHVFMAHGVCNILHSVWILKKSVVASERPAHACMGRVIRERVASQHLYHG